MLSYFIGPNEETEPEPTPAEGKVEIHFAKHYNFWVNNTYYKWQIVISHMDKALVPF